YGHVEAASAAATRQTLLDELAMRSAELLSIEDADGEGEGEDIPVADAKGRPSPRLVWVDDELRVVVRIDVIIGHIALRDQLEWDVAPLLRPPPPPPAALLHASDGLGSDAESLDDGDGDGDSEDSESRVPQSPRAAGKGSGLSRWRASALRDWASGALQGQTVTPEHVARVVCTERGLGGEFETAYAHAAREQLYAFAKSFLLAGYAYRPQLLHAKRSRRPLIVDDRELARAVLAPLTASSVVRQRAATTFAPLIAHLHSVDVERLEKDADREARRKRRTAPGGSSSSAASRGIGGRSARDASRGAGVPDREAHRTNRTMIALPSWFADDLPPDTRSFVDVPGEGAHFLDAYDARAAHEASTMAPPQPPPHIASLSSAVASLSAFDNISSSSDDPSSSMQVAAPLSQLLGRRMANGSSSSAAAMGGLDIALASSSSLSVVSPGYASGGAYTGLTPGSASQQQQQTPQQLARDKLRNPTGRPRGRPSILEKALRDAAARRNSPTGGAVPTHLSGRPLEELCTRWRCMSCGIPPDRTPLIRRGPEGMHSLCDECGLVYAQTRRFRDVDAAEITCNVALVCGPLIAAPAEPLSPQPISAAAAADPAAPTAAIESPLTSLTASITHGDDIDDDDDDDNDDIVDQQQRQIQNDDPL
ncbi:SWI/SNF chromatin-remodeling complex subunit, partial [Coemansia furcata]